MPNGNGPEDDLLRSLEAELTAQRFESRPDNDRVQPPHIEIFEAPDYGTIGPLNPPGVVAVRTVGSLMVLGAATYGGIKLAKKVVNRVR